MGGARTLIGRGGARLVPAPSLCPGSSNPWAGRGAARARAGELVCVASSPSPLSYRAPPVGRAGEVEPCPGRPWGLTVGKVWLEEEVASSPGRWRPGLDRGCRGLQAGSRRGRARDPGLKLIPGALGTDLGKELLRRQGKQIRSWREAPPLLPGRRRLPAPSPGIPSTAPGARAMEPPRGSGTGGSGPSERRRFPTE